MDDDYRISNDDLEAYLEFHLHPQAKILQPGDLVRYARVYDTHDEYDSYLILSEIDSTTYLYACVVFPGNGGTARFARISSGSFHRNVQVYREGMELK